VRRVLLCGGKVFYDLLAGRAKRAGSGGEQVAIVRFEQLAPLSADDVTAALAPYGDAQLVWVQEEPANQGAWPFMALNLPALPRRSEHGRRRHPSAGLACAADLLADRPVPGPVTCGT